MSKILELKEKRARLVNEAREVNSRQNFTTEDDAQYNKIMQEVDSLKTQIDREERLFALEAETAGASNGNDYRANPTPEKQGQLPKFESRALQQLADNKETAEVLQANNSESHAKLFRDYVTGKAELRGLTAGNAASAGYLTIPTRYLDQIIADVENAVLFRTPGWATVIPVTTSQSLGVTTLKTRPGNPTWAGENSAVSWDTSTAFGKRELQPSMTHNGQKVSRRLLQLNPRAEQYVLSLHTYQFAVAQEQTFMTGTGANQPLGVFTASDSGISTGRDVSTDNTTTAITADNLHNVKYATKIQYRSRAKWLFHRDAIKMIAKLKDGEGQYLWQPGIVANAPDVLLGAPVFESEYAPNTFTTGQYVGLYGDMSWYWIADGISMMEIQRQDELFAATNEVGFIMRQWVDGQPIKEEAFTRVKLA